MKTKTAVLKNVGTGMFWVGDLCYLLGHSDEEHEQWMDLLHETDFFDGEAIGTLKGEKVIGFNTKHGDGVYNDQYGNEYPVDAGIIGIAPRSIVPDDALELGALHQFTDDIVCSNTDGFMSFNGMVLIDTDIAVF